ncbi:MAG TPA: hypothetical protein VFT85_06300 [Acidimicrobiia bacterium]|nr:hypothetical protein [Acidimicrobiia bacterium]
MLEPRASIGTLRERPLHASLKDWYARPGDQVECPVEGFVIDLVRDDLLIEIQTRSFSSMKRKLTSLLELGHRVRIVHPIAIDRWIVKIDESGTVLGRRRSPKHGDPTDVFAELVSFPELLAHPNLEIDLVLTNEDEIRRHDPDMAWRRRGWIVVERHLLEVVESLPLRDVGDITALIPAGVPDPFTTADLADALGRPRRAGQQMAYCLARAGILNIAGKRGKSVLYEVAA